MFSKLTSRLILTAALIGGSAFCLPAATLSGATAFGAGSDGTWSSGITATSACCQFIGVEQGSFTDFNNLVTPPISLFDGNYTFYLESSDWTTGYGVTTGGVNLFFDGSSTPGISVYITPVFDKTDFSQSFAVTGNTITTASLANSGVNGSGTSVYTNGGLTITLTGLQWVGGGPDAYDPGLTVQRVDFTVAGAGAATTPEPATMVLFGAGLAALGLVRRKRLPRSV
ncbi:MAG TPA: PEP-CTERM sorting domain-containing protein [Candidatus Sulfopaludibacter sp.]|nr:PEP-CTERM sorting domain-containing protein [Candidatus Sulfopaludibacter sp.]